MLISLVFACANGYASNKSATTTTMGTRYDHHKPKGTRIIICSLVGDDEFDVDVIDDERKSLPAAFRRRLMVRLDDDDEGQTERRYSLNNAFDDDIKMMTTMRTSIDSSDISFLFQTPWALYRVAPSDDDE